MVQLLSPLNSSLHKLKIFDSKGQLISNANYKIFKSKTTDAWVVKFSNNFSRQSITYQAEYDVLREPQVPVSLSFEQTKLNELVPELSNAGLTDLANQLSQFNQDGPISVEDFIQMSGARSYYNLEIAQIKTNYEGGLYQYAKHEKHQGRLIGACVEGNKLLDWVWQQAYKGPAVQTTTSVVLVLKRYEYDYYEGQPLHAMFKVSTADKSYYFDNTPQISSESNQIVLQSDSDSFSTSQQASTKKSMFGKLADYFSSKNKQNLSLIHI